MITVGQELPCNVYSIPEQLSHALLRSTAAAARTTTAFDAVSDPIDKPRCCAHPFTPAAAAAAGIAVEILFEECCKMQQVSVRVGDHQIKALYVVIGMCKRKSTSAHQHNLKRRHVGGLRGGGGGSGGDAHSESGGGGAALAHIQDRTSLCNYLAACRMNRCALSHAMVNRCFVPHHASLLSK